MQQLLATVAVPTRASALSAPAFAGAKEYASDPVDALIDTIVARELSMVLLMSMRPLTALV
jgi:hypothetical protein